MSQQPQPRPWFRLASLARPGSAPPPPAQAQTQAQAPGPRPPFMRPTITQTFAPPPPPAPTPPSPQASIQTPPSPPPPIRPSATAPPSPPSPPPPAATTPPPNTTPPAIKNPSPKPSPTISASYVAQSPKPRISAPLSPTPARLFSPTLSPPPSSREAVAASPITTNATRVPLPPVPSPQIPKYQEPKTPSPKTKPLTPPPSPLTLPPPQLVNSDQERNNKLIPPETEQKVVMVHDNILEKAKAIPMDNHYNHHSNPTTHTKKEKVNHNMNPHKKLSDSEDLGMSMITLAGENKGAIMELTPSQNPRNGHFAGNRPIKIGNQDKSWSDSEKLASDSDGKRKHKDKNHSAKTSPFHAYTNSNVQGVNNSIMYNCSCTHNDPGVHLSVNRKPKDPIHPHHV